MEHKLFNKIGVATTLTVSGTNAAVGTDSLHATMAKNINQ
jgi:hypothetical protein